MEIAMSGIKAVKNQAPPASCFKHHEMNSLSIYQISVPFLWNTKTTTSRIKSAPLSYAGEQTEDADLKISKKESLSSQYQLSCLQASSHPSPALRDPRLQ